MRRPKRYCSRYIVCSHQHELVADNETVPNDDILHFEQQQKPFFPSNISHSYWQQNQKKKKLNPMHRTKHPFTLTHPINIHTLSSCTKAKRHTKNGNIFIYAISLFTIQHPKRHNTDSIRTGTIQNARREWAERKKEWRVSKKAQIESRHTENRMETFRNKFVVFVHSSNVLLLNFS